LPIPEKIRMSKRETTAAVVIDRVLPVEEKVGTASAAEGRSGLFTQRRNGEKGGRPITRLNKKKARRVPGVVKGS